MADVSRFAPDIQFGIELMGQIEVVRMVSRNAMTQTTANTSVIVM